MAPIIVRFNGPTTVEEIVETPDPHMSAGEYLEALLDAHAIDAPNGAELVMKDGEPIPDDLDVELLAGQEIRVQVAPAPVEGEAQPIEMHKMTKGELIAYAEAHDIDLGDAHTKAEILDALKVPE